VHTTVQDIQYALRLMQRNAGLTLIALSALAISIGANTTIFSVIYGVLLRPLPFPHSEHLITVLERQGEERVSVAYPDYMDIRDRVRSFESFTAQQRTNFNLTGAGEAERVQARLVSSTFFRTLGVNIPIGRDFNTEDDREGAAPTTILSDGFWRRRFGGAQNIIGRVITLSDRQYTVIGIAPAWFRYGDGIELYAPLTLGKTPMWGRGAHSGLVMIGRLKPGVTMQQAAAEMDALYRAVDQANPKEGMPNRLAAVAPLAKAFTEDIQRPLWIMFAAVAFMLLIACSNVATLLLARATARQRELAIRNAMGAGRTRIVRQLLTESVLLSVTGGALGILLSAWGISLLRAAKPVNVPRVEDISLHPWVLAFTVSVSALTGVLFGILPALHASKATANDLLKDTAPRAGGARRAGRSRAALVVTEFALALVLLIGAGLMLKSFVRLLGVDLGFVVEDLVTFQVSIVPEKYDGQSALNLLDQFRNEITWLPGAQNATYANGAPLVNTTTQSFFRVEDDMRDLKTLRNGVLNITSPEYIDTLKIPLLRGRYLTHDDGANTPKVVVIDETLAREVFPGQDPIGRRIKYGDNDKPKILEIVGIVGHVRHVSLDEAYPVRQQLYIPMTQAPDDYLTQALRQTTVVLRAGGDPTTISQAVRAKLTQLDSTLPIFDVRTYDRVVKDDTEVRRFTASLLGVFAGVALFLATIGIYGVLSYTVEQRTHEIGVRMALGASASVVVRMIVLQAMRTVGAGLAIGIAAALALTRYISSMLYGVRSWDPFVFVAITALLGGVALLASYLPARHATMVDPIMALRYE
jgi:putative ABC transport system permease protein